MATSRMHESDSRVPSTIRRDKIAKAVQRTGYMSVSSIASELGVSDMTIRRDLLDLEKRGLLIRTHGGAVAPSDASQEAFDAEEPSFDHRRSRNADAKASIAAAAAGLISPNETIGLDVGSSTLALAEKIADRSDLRIVTNNLRAALRLGSGGNAVYVIGGLVRGPEMSAIGPSAVEQLRHFGLDCAFIGVSGLSPSGLYDYSPEDTQVKLALMNCAERIVVLCDSSKFERRSLARICDLSAIDALVTDRAPQPNLLDALHAAKVEVVIVDAPSSSGGSASQQG
ncbi:DeoR/GlpR family DNA-binding transcription regulator [Microvirga pakistanensis]|uniref:DeoR/GlpR family DNA-binding transcription regulator n=1 Tax=Microvirga pakistanensis TaxID=1682650 RepID=UPI00106DBD33|nr:DeoR/GlpR family DNA-binding transcription regulator [Microvirga pakistanensis]